MDTDEVLQHAKFTQRADAKTQTLQHVGTSESRPDDLVPKPPDRAGCNSTPERSLCSLCGEADTRRSPVAPLSALSNKAILNLLSRPSPPLTDAALPPRFRACPVVHGAGPGPVMPPQDTPTRQPPVSGRPTSVTGQTPRSAGASAGQRGGRGSGRTADEAHRSY
ncbi:hypothetical protein AAFF_G00113600 [Aldrovandia affinis]|uniref:Uncharacterized protein n=1 Tax=Aldrovandia affinis TaxID=143900 RepID=A0AAD7WAG1_9TELE|nr:hypothetical protein AAFF_G00113600 [Aldrovandia affinis]